MTRSTLIQGWTEQPSLVRKSGQRKGTKNKESRHSFRLDLQALSLSLTSSYSFMSWLKCTNFTWLKSTNFWHTLQSTLVRLEGRSWQTDWAHCLVLLPVSCVAASESMDDGWDVHDRAWERNVLFGENKWEWKHRVVWSDECSPADDFILKAITG